MSRHLTVHIFFRFSSHDKDICRFFGAPTFRVFGDHLIRSRSFVRYPLSRLRGAPARELRPPPSSSHLPPPPTLREACHRDY